MSDPAAQPLDGTRILLVEDEALVAMEIEAALEDAGAIVVGPAASFDAAYAQAQSADIDAAILDVDLGGREVFPAAELLDRRGIPFLFHTANVPRDGFAGRPVCVKPVEPGHLIRILNDIRMKD